MGKNNEQKQQEAKPADNYQRNDPTRARSVGSFRAEGEIFGNEQNTANNSYSSGTDRRGEGSLKQPETNIGKIISQLRDLQTSHLAYVEAHEQRLAQRLEQARRHHQQVLAKMQDMESAIQELIAELEDEEHF